MYSGYSFTLIRILGEKNAKTKLVISLLLNMSKMIEIDNDKLNSNDKRHFNKTLR